MANSAFDINTLMAMAAAMQNVPAGQTNNRPNAGANEGQAAVANNVRVEANPDFNAGEAEMRRTTDFMAQFLHSMRALGVNIVPEWQLPKTREQLEAEARDMESSFRNYIPGRAKLANGGDPTEELYEGLDQVCRVLEELSNATAAYFFLNSLAYRAQQDFGRAFNSVDASASWLERLDAQPSNTEEWQSQHDRAEEWLQSSLDGADAAHAMLTALLRIWAESSITDSDLPPGMSADKITVPWLTIAERLEQARLRKMGGRRDSREGHAAHAAGTRLMVEGRGFIRSGK